jgi:type IV secretion system protein VirD4
MFEDAAEPPPPVREFGFFEDEPDDDGEGAEQAALQTRFRRVARQAALDPDDGLEL